MLYILQITYYVSSMDVNNKHFKFVVHIPRANLIGEYDINGRILILPIQGKGPANITFGK